MATVLPVIQPTYSVVVSSGPIDTGVMMGVNITLTDQIYKSISIIESERGREGFPGPQGSGFRYFRNAQDYNSQIEASGTSDVLLLQPSGTVSLGFDQNTKTLTIGADPLPTGSLLPINIGGTNNNGLYDINFLLTYDGTKFVSSPIDATLLSNFMTSGIYLKIGDGYTNRITYRISDRLDILSSTGVHIGYNNINNTLSLSTSIVASTGISISYDNINNSLAIAASGKTAGLNSLVSQLIFG